MAKSKFKQLEIPFPDMEQKPQKCRSKNKYIITLEQEIDRLRGILIQNNISDMTILDLMKGKTITHKTDAKVDVDLIIESVKEEVRVIQIEPDTPANDWWGASENRRVYVVTFTNGFIKEYSFLSEIKFKD